MTLKGHACSLLLIKRFANCGLFCNNLDRLPGFDEFNQQTITLRLCTGMATCSPFSQQKTLSPLKLCLNLPSVAYLNFFSLSTSCPSLATQELRMRNLRQ